MSSVAIEVGARAPGRPKPGSTLAEGRPAYSAAGVLQ